MYCSSNVPVTACANLSLCGSHLMLKVVIMGCVTDTSKWLTFSFADKHAFGEFQVHKRCEDTADKPRYLCEVLDDSCRTIGFRFETESRRDSFVFFLITPHHPPSGTSCHPLLPSL